MGGKERFRSFQKARNFSGEIPAVSQASSKVTIPPPTIHAWAARFVSASRALVRNRFRARSVW